MKKSRKRREGVFILPRTVIEAILKKKGTKGIAFACKMKGKAPKCRYQLMEGI